MLCFGYKWLGERDVKSISLPNYKVRYKGDQTDDTDVLLELWKLFDEADIVIGHNGDRFDIRRSQGYMDKKLSKVVPNYHPPSPFKTVDTLKQYRKHYDLLSYKLDSIGRYFGFGVKVQHTGIQLWIDCMDGKQGAWDLMDKYVKQDVNLLEEAYRFILPRITNHPNVAVLLDKPYNCINCGSKHINTKAKEFSKTNTSWYQRYRCMSCGKWMRGKTREEMDSVDKPQYTNA